MTGTSTRSTLSAAQLCAGCGMNPRGAPIVGSCATGSQLLTLNGVQKTDSILLSDRLIWQCACAHCGPQPATTAFEGQAAAAISDAITICARCGQTSVKVDIREQFALHELADRFADQPVPAAWGLINEAVVEFDPPKS